MVALFCFYGGLEETNLLAPTMTKLKNIDLKSQFKGQIGWPNDRLTCYMCACV